MDQGKRGGYMRFAPSILQPSHCPELEFFQHSSFYFWGLGRIWWTAFAKRQEVLWRKWHLKAYTVHVLLACAEDSDSCLAIAGQMEMGFEVKETSCIVSLNVPQLKATDLGWTDPSASVSRQWMPKEEQLMSSLTTYFNAVRDWPWGIHLGDPQDVSHESV